MENEKYILTVPFTAEEVEKAIELLKRRKAQGPDNLLAEHLIEGSQSVVICLTNILNTITNLEAIPDSFKSGHSQTLTAALVGCRHTKSAQEPHSILHCS